MAQDTEHRSPFSLVVAWKSACTLDRLDTEIRVPRNRTSTREYCRKEDLLSAPPPERGAGAEEKEAWEEEWDEDERMTSGWYENAAYGSVVYLAEGLRGCRWEPWER